MSPPSGEWKTLSVKEETFRYKLWKSGLSDTNIGYKVGISREAVRQWRDKHNLKCNYRIDVGKSSMKRRLKLYRNGYSDTKIARIQNKKVSAIRKWRYDHRLEPN